jgi:hypothetical protein
VIPGDEQQRPEDHVVFQAEKGKKGQQKATEGILEVGGRIRGPGFAVDVDEKQRDGDCGVDMKREEKDGCREGVEEPQEERKLFLMPELGEQEIDLYAQQRGPEGRAAPDNEDKDAPLEQLTQRIPGEDEK